MKRTFLPINDFPAYNNALNYLLVNSNILNTGNDLPSVHSEFWDKQNIIFHIAELQGDSDGNYIHQGSKLKALIPLTQVKIDVLKKKFEEIKKVKVKQGYAAPQIMSKEIMDEFYSLNARLTCHEAELEFLKKKLEEYTDKDQKEDDNLMLVYGLQAYCKLYENILISIDGQKVSEIDGIMVIDDKRSPYHGLAVEHFRELVKRYQADRKKANQEKLLRMQEEARSKGNFVPKQLPVKSPSRVSISSLPPYPMEYKNYLIEKKQRIRK